MKSAFIISISLLLVTLFLFAAAPEQASPPAEAARLNNLGVAYMNQQSFAKALKAFQDAARDPKLTAARLNQGIALLSLEERIDTNSAAGELVFHVFGAIAHFERRLIAERTKDGIAAARARGKHPGRQPLDPEKIAAALELVKAGLSPTVAARQLGLGRSTVYREVSRAGAAR